MIAVNCVQCGRQFAVYPSTIRKGCGKYCSMACKFRAQNRTPEQKFNRWVRRSDDPNACWGWNGAKAPNGYSVLNYWDGQKSKRTDAHRTAYKLYVGPIPKGMFVCHRCDNPICTNPAHLFVGTHADNMADMIAKGRQSNKNKPSGERNAAAKLSLADVEVIRQSPAVGTHLAAQFGVSKSAISHIRLRKTWRHIP